MAVTTIQHTYNPLGGDEHNFLLRTSGACSVLIVAFSVFRRTWHNVRRLSFRQTLRLPIASVKQRAIYCFLDTSQSDYLIFIFFFFYLFVFPNYRDSTLPIGFSFFIFFAA